MPILCLYYVHEIFNFHWAYFSIKKSRHDVIIFLQPLTIITLWYTVRVPAHGCSFHVLGLSFLEIESCFLYDKTVLSLYYSIDFTELFLWEWTDEEPNTRSSVPFKAKYCITTIHGNTSYEDIYSHNIIVRQMWITIQQEKKGNERRKRCYIYRWKIQSGI